MAHDPFRFKPGWRPHRTAAPALGPGPVGPSAWYVRKTGSDTNGGSSPSVRSTGTDGVVSGGNTLTSASANWSNADIGHGIYIGTSNVNRKIINVMEPNTMQVSGAALSNGSGRTWTVGGAWLTLSGTALLSSVPIAGGDTVYIGPGEYLGTTMTLRPGSNVTFFGDVDGSRTGDAPGYVIISNIAKNHHTAYPLSGSLTASNVSNITFTNIIFYNGTSSASLVLLTSCSNFTFLKCCFFSAGTGSSQITTNFGFSSNILIDRCLFFGPGFTSLTVTLARGTGVDYNCGVTIQNCLFASNAGVLIGGTGAGSALGGGVSVLNCTYVGRGGAITVSDGNTSTSIPCTLTNSLLFSANIAVMNAITPGQWTEDYNVLIGSGGRTNVTAGAHSVSDLSITSLPHIGQAQLFGFAPQSPFSLMGLSAALGFGNASSPPSVDLLSGPRPAGGITLFGSGSASSGGSAALTDSSQTWGTNSFAGFVVKITGGTGSGQIKSIASNTATVLTVDGNWKTQPGNTSTYVIYDGAFASSGQATAGSTTTLTDGNAAWGTNQWQGYTLSIDGGTGSGQSLTVVSNTATVLTFASATAPDSTSTYQLFRGTDGNTINNAVGCFERGNTAVRDTVTTQAGSNSWLIQGSGYHDFQVPVSALTTRLSIYGRYDSNYSGPLPSMTILNGTECGVPNVTCTMIGAANQWEFLVLDIAPTAAGIVTLRIQSGCTTPTGQARFDTEVTA